MFMEGALENGVDEKTADTIWRSCITAGAYAFNAAHAVSYGMIAWHTMWLKQNHPTAFYVAALTKYVEKDKQMRILRDAAAHGLKIYPPHPSKSDISWKPAKKGIRAGFMQIPGIGEKTARAIVDYAPKAWSELIQVKGIGPKTIQTLSEFVHQEDPFGVHRLHKVLEKVRTALDNGELGDLPAPTHTAMDIPYEASSEDIPVVWCGVMLERNLRDLFEYHLSKKGEELDPTTVKAPEKREWVVMKCEDEDEITYVTFDRYNYPKWKDQVWGITPKKDVILVRGVKRGFLNKRDVLVKEMWVIEED
jgi:DNA polymerase-3 subunit alpha